MELLPIRTKRDYDAALKQAKAWRDAPANSTDGKRLDVLTLLIADYEARHFPIEPPDPVEFLLFIMEQRGLSRKDLEPYIGSRARVAEVLRAGSGGGRQLGAFLREHRQRRAEAGHGARTRVQAQGDPIEFALRIERQIEALWQMRTSKAGRALGPVVKLHLIRRLGIRKSVEA